MANGGWETGNILGVALGGAFRPIPVSRGIKNLKESGLCSTSGLGAAMLVCRGEKGERAVALETNLAFETKQEGRCEAITREYHSSAHTSFPYSTYRKSGPTLRWIPLASGMEQKNFALNFDR